ncbi:SDR family oxidoreductase [Rhodococcus artemisiae]|uniref:SDR family oxidoreductase n=1 Tax=Rhodococcus artemisiae TaxID=714159 RepID=A0ABU7LBZ9_9NOCA|nr:SDR family oxidoreductase [Rhodococcus artemisiae]MEE2058437.1 SDR family oxidoreductase [Rhodococcus artemisiae]
MTTESVIAVSGATGHIGRAVAGHLTDTAARLRLVVRDPDRAPTGAWGIVQAEYGDLAAATAALRGAQVLFMVSAAESADRLDQHCTFIDAAADAGVQHVVYTSFLGASPEATFTLARDHWATEQHLRASGMAWTFLRDSFYLDFLPTLAGSDGVIRGPAADGQVGAVAREDVARSATAVLSDLDAHAGRTYDLTGPQALTLAEVARMITDVSGQEVTYVEESVEQAYESRRHYGVPDWQLDAWVSTYTAIAAGELAPVTDTVEQLTGTGPIGLVDLLRRP